MIVADTKDLEASLAKAILMIERKLKNMVEGFAYEFTLTAVSKTPLGDADTNRTRYLDREFKYDLDPIEGFARGSWQASLDGSLKFQEFYGQNSGSNAADSVKLTMQNYKIGQKVYIGNFGPYIVDLEYDHSDQTEDNGIMKPTIDQVLTSYRIDLQHYYSVG